MCNTYGTFRCALAKLFELLIFCIWWYNTIRPSMARSLEIGIPCFNIIDVVCVAEKKYHSSQMTPCITGAVKKALDVYHST